MDVFLWAVLPYLTIALLVGGLIWRYRYDQFGWTTRSSQLYESRLLRIGSPLFHFGILVVLIGHFMGLVIPQSWTDAIGVTEDSYHAVALGLGGIAGFATLVGIGILIFRRRATGPVFMATTKNDKTMYVVLVAAIVTGLATTIISAVDPSPDQNYRETVAPWFRSLFILQPDIATMTQAPFSFHLHTVCGMALFILWPFTRLVHAFTAPVQYLFRPYIVYRSRDHRPTTGGATRRGWAPVGTPDRAPDPTARRARR
ncbi:MULTISPECIES: respiratory nitrate reductase subunit gamma [unclassified Microbacterium]|uniref:respiratory nitrate reductase subunit gamma n=1 Tax=unclassified Microbacterium TaxID=2609290 RepID=UPI00214C2FE3|nr:MULTISPECIES: respiratory nitrate reductase subunit gamma [unclassified Microbacterium]MCR2811166.1 respiratory nitrate reductase subunit gamma [Microbacterium sp. zg.B185]WIM20721.1 respiratory nitrate reductase subunit gamma [Microbacterium sp. zg-B185]